MSTEERRIRFRIDFSRILSVLSDQIYQSPLALLRENTQNAFDAIRMRIALGQSFDPAIQVTVSPDSIVIVDNGIGMTVGRDRGKLLVRGLQAAKTRMQHSCRHRRNLRNRSDGKLWHRQRTCRRE